MTIVEQAARFLAARLNLPFEGADPAGAVFFGCMPERPARAVCVYASDLRDAGDLEGTRLEVAIRSDLDSAWPLARAAEIMALLDGRRDLIFVPEGDYVIRVETEQGFEFAGMAGGNTQVYAARFRVYHCGA